MHVNPNTTIRLLRHVRLDETYENTIYFANETAQRNYFLNKTWATLNENTYQRVANSKGSLKVQLPASTVSDCNYMMYQNTDYEQKWFYAFITSYEYVNDTTTLITFEIDVMQTYAFDYTLLQSYVDREHASNDTVGLNIVDEGLNFTEYQFDEQLGSGYFETWGILIQSIYNANGVQSNEFHRNTAGLITGMQNIFLDDSGSTTCAQKATSWLNTVQNDYSEDGSGILGITMYPRELWIASITPDTPHYFQATVPTSLGGYVPKNKKLLTYPYTFLGIANGTGDIAQFRYEFFRNREPEFQIIGDLASVTAVCVPINYNKGDNVYTGQNPKVPNYQCAVYMNNFPMVNWVLDSFKIWWSQNKVAVANNILTDVGSTVAKGLITEGATLPSDTIKTLSNVSNSIGRYDQAKRLPDKLKGSAGCGFNILTDTQDFCHINIHIQPQDARIIDDFFTKYGYATHRVKVPNRNVRPHWTYTKTIGCNLECNAPADAVKKICSIFDNGITFWNNGDEVGQYNLDNTV